MVFKSFHFASRKTCTRALRDELRALAEKEKKIRQVVMKLAGKKDDNKSLGEISVSSLSIVLEAGPLDEMYAIESVVRSHQEHLLTLQKA